MKTVSLSPGTSGVMEEKGLFSMAEQSSTGDMLFSKGVDDIEFCFLDIMIFFLFKFLT